MPDPKEFSGEVYDKNGGGNTPIISQEVAEKAMGRDRDKDDVDWECIEKREANEQLPISRRETARALLQLKTQYERLANDLAAHCQSDISQVIGELNRRMDNMAMQINTLNEVVFEPAAKKKHDYEALEACVVELESAQKAASIARQIINKRANKVNDEALETFGIVADRLDELEKRVPTLEQITTGALKAIKRTLIAKQRYDAAAKIREVIVMLTGKTKPILPEMLDGRKDAESCLRHSIFGPNCPISGLEKIPPEIIPSNEELFEMLDEDKPNSPQPGELVWCSGETELDEKPIEYTYAITYDKGDEWDRLVQQDEIRELRIAREMLGHLVDCSSDEQARKEIRITLGQISNRVTIERRTE
ncbi:hypothetical protein ES705_16424 [subsurface metagenome]